MAGNRRLVWHESFQGSQIDKSRWKHEVSAYGGGNWEFQVYNPDRENSYVENGTLYIKPTLITDNSKFGQDFMSSRYSVLDVKALWGECTRSECFGDKRKAKDGTLPPVLSAKLISRYAFKYGRMEVVAKMPLGDWIWPAIWMVSRDDAYGEWPRSGEIDLVESRGNRNFRDCDARKILSTLHYGAPAENGSIQDGYEKSTSERWAPRHKPLMWAEEFHTYFVDWTPGHIQLGVDNDVIMDQPTPREGYWNYGGFSGTNPWTRGGRDAPFDKEMVIQLNVAVGGTNGYFPDDPQKPWRNDERDANGSFWAARHQWYPTWQGDSCALQVKDIKVFQ
ncbi:hypothetical protein BaRGS_00039541 [Batillaria attramentaria]|uniref:GH16 domain-containing protein n=1 Tax=Batillaria attramentaria TaxID=370345 RepID=A0ABD0J3J0_9CAEN